MTSPQTSLAAARAPATSPLAALLQIPSTFAFTLADSVGALWITDLHSATYWDTAAELGAALVPVADVEVDAGAGLLVELVPVAVDPLVVELLLLPHPATSAPHSNAATNIGDLDRIIGAP
jgi:hypothetical protein